MDSIWISSYFVENVDFYYPYFIWFIMFHNAFGNVLIDMVFLLVSFMRIYAFIIKVILVIINFLNDICTCIE